LAFLVFFSAFLIFFIPAVAAVPPGVGRVFFDALLFEQSALLAGVFMEPVRLVCSLKRERHT